MQRAGDLACDVGLHLEHIGQRRIESLLPLCRGHGPGLNPDQFGADPHPAGAVRMFLPTDGRRQQVLGPQPGAISCGAFACADTRWSWRER